MIWLGTFATTLEAALAYDEAAKAMYGSCARLNFPGFSKELSSKSNESVSCATTTSTSESTMTASSHSECMLGVDERLSGAAVEAPTAVSTVKTEPIEVGGTVMGFNFFNGFRANEGEFRNGSSSAMEANEFNGFGSNRQDEMYNVGIMDSNYFDGFPPIQEGLQHWFKHKGNLLALLEVTSFRLKMIRSVNLKFGKVLQMYILVFHIGRTPKYVWKRLEH